LADVAEMLRPSIAGFADANTLRSIDESIEQSKIAADGELPRPELRELSNTATQLTGKTELYSQGLYFDDTDRESPLGRLSAEQLTLVRDVADVAARSLRAASTGDEVEANDECQEGLSWAFSMAERLADENLLYRIRLLVDNAIPS
jgi:hypothetical protein